MPPSRRAIAMALAFTVLLIACADPFTSAPPASSRGVAVDGLNVCPTGFPSCAVWSADSKTLYTMATVGTSNVVSLVAVDAATRGSRIVGSIDRNVRTLVTPADGAAIYVEVQDTAPPGGITIKRMSLSDGTTTTVAKAMFPEFLVSPDETTLAYHPPGSPFADDTIVLLDLPTGTRRATVSGFSQLMAFSPDGTRLLSYNGRAMLIWHVTTGARDTIPVATGRLFGAAWLDTIRLLFSSADGKTYTDTSLGGSALTYRVRPSQSSSSIDSDIRIQWLPARSAMLTTQSSMICDANDCESNRFDFVYTTATRSTAVGASSGLYLALVSASPDGRWLAHVELPGPLYLLNLPTP